ncbi:hypothetical protein [Methylobacterium iners]|uniref:hypothetical protein n=1 Tax=Methylobacterium iners TaxID=418707 RepID=UPI001EE25149|nr:hypothetical protein [Methylobacterium iners]
MLITPIPAMVDYPNHLARMFILARDGTPAAHPFYQVAWAVHPNLAVDLIVPQLARIVGVEPATRLFLLAAQILTVTGACAIEFAVKRRLQVSGFVALMALYSIPFAWGFLNFQFALGLALWGIAGSIVLQDRAWTARAAVHTVFVAMLFGAHLFALGIYGFVLGVHELWRAWSRSSPMRDIASRFLALALPALIAFGFMATNGGSVERDAMLWAPEWKIVLLFTTLNGYCLPLAFAGTGIFLGIVYLLAKRGALHAMQSGLWHAIGLTFLFVIFPVRFLFDTSFVDLRITVAALLIVPAFVVVSPPSRTWARLAGALIVAVTLLNIGSALAVSATYKREYQALIDSLGQVKKGARILAGHSGDGTDPPIHDLADYPIYHAVTLAVAYADAFVPTLFTGVGKQPIVVKPAHRHLAAPDGGIIATRLLRKIAQGMPVEGAPPYARAWTKEFDYLYVVGRPVPNPLPDVLTPLAAASRFTLYRIEKPAKAD